MDIYTSDSSDSDSRELKILHYGRQNLTTETLNDNLLNLYKMKSFGDIGTMFLNHNALKHLPQSIGKFNNLQTLDLSSNHLTSLPDILAQCPITSLIAKNNQLNNESLPKSLVSKYGDGILRELNLSGNLFTHFPEHIFELKGLKFLYLGGNQITSISKDIGRLQSLQILSIGGNAISEVPDSVGNLSNLQGLILYDNIIEYLPPSIAKLKNLKSLLLHKNRLKHLPRDIITLRNLVELSLRENPLVVRFVQDISLNPPTLLELTARTLRMTSIPYGPEDLPSSLMEYLRTANCCVNPKCTGVFFDNRIEHIKFVDFCGKYRVPLLEYLCSSKCIEPVKQIDEEPQPGASGFMMRKVLLG